MREDRAIIAKLQIIPEWFIRYKFVNSLFLGVSVGSIFLIYAPLDPSIFSLGGIALALGMLLIARLYSHLLNSEWFFRLSLFVETILVAAILYFLLFPYTYQTALLVYIGYQITFAFGSYLVRAETLLLSSSETLTTLDTAKQLGYLGGMLLSFLFYKIIALYGVESNQEKLYALHFLLLALQIIVIALILKSFKRRNGKIAEGSKI